MKKFENEKFIKLLHDENTKNLKFLKFLVLVCLYIVVSNIFSILFKNIVDDC